MKTSSEFLLRNIPSLLIIPIISKDFMALKWRFGVSRTVWRGCLPWGAGAGHMFQLRRRRRLARGAWYWWCAGTLGAAVESVLRLYRTIRPTARCVASFSADCGMCATGRAPPRPERLPQNPYQCHEFCGSTSHCALMHIKVDVRSKRKICCRGNAFVPATCGSRRLRLHASRNATVSR
jgi:hypothetical protein